MPFLRFLFLGLPSLLFCHITHATTFDPNYTLAVALAEDVQLAVIATIGASEVGPNKQGGITTCYELKTEQIVVGSYTGPEPLTVCQPVGAYNGVASVIPEAPELMVGKRYLLHLNDNPVSPFVMLNRFQFEISKDGTLIDYAGRQIKSISPDGRNIEVGRVAEGSTPAAHPLQNRSQGEIIFLSGPPVTRLDLIKTPDSSTTYSLTEAIGLIKGLRSQAKRRARQSLHSTASREVFSGSTNREESNAAQ